MDLVGAKIAYLAIHFFVRGFLTSTGLENYNFEYYGNHFFHSMDVSCINAMH